MEGGYTKLRRILKKSMKKKFARVLGVGLTIALLTSLIVSVTPASAYPLLWYYESNVPKTEANVLAPAAGINIVDLAVNGDTMFAATQNTSYPLFKSTDGGATWTNMVTSTLFPSGVSVKSVAIATDDANVIAFVGSDNKVYYSTTGGASWSNLGLPANTTFAVTASTVDEIAMSTAYGTYRYIAVGATTTGGSAEMFVMLLAMAQSWYPMMAYAAGEAAGQLTVNAIEFSPNFWIDSIITCISGNADDAVFQMFRCTDGGYAWNGSIPFLSGWGTGVNIDDGTYGTTIAGGIGAASIALPASYLGSDEGERLAYVSVAGAASGGGVTRLVDTYKTHFSTWSAGDEGRVGSIAYHEADKLLAGDYASNRVHYCLSAGAAYPRFARVNLLKQPGGAEKTLVAWNGDTAVAATSGDESAFAVSMDDGYSWNDISLIDTALNVTDDVATSADGKTVYLATHDTASAGTSDVSIWRRASAWQRIYSLRDVTEANADYLVRVAPEDASVVYISSTGTTNIWVSKDSGLNTWKSIPCYKLDALVQDFVVESADKAYAIDADECSKTSNAGSSWGTAKSLDGLTNAQTITLASNGDVLVGGVGKVAFSKDGASSFTRILDTTSAAAVHIAADKDYDTNNKIFIAAGTTVERGTADKNTVWSPKGPTMDSSYSVKGMVQHEGVVYIVAGNNTASRMYRAINLLTGATSALCLWSDLSTNFALTRAPRALKLSAGPTLWAVASSFLMSFSDPIATTGPTAKTPADGFEVKVNPGTGRAYNVTFTFERPAGDILGYVVSVDLQIATDSGFEGLIYDYSISGIDAKTTAKVIGPTGVQNYQCDFMPGEVYYWRVRVSADGPIYSPWTQGGSFMVEASVPFAIISPTGGSTNVPMQPTFVWKEYEGAIGYEIEVSETDSTFAIKDWSHSTTDAFYATTEADALKYSTTYYWRVRGVTAVPAVAGKAAPGGPWVTSIFTIEPKPVEPTPPVVIEPTPPTEIKIVEVEKAVPAAIPSYLLWTIIGVGALLVIALIILIVRTRRVA